MPSAPDYRRASSCHLATLRDLLTQHLLTEEDLPLLLRELDEVWCSRLTKSLRSGHRGLPAPCRVTKQSFRALFLTYHAINDGLCSFSPVLFAKWNALNEQHSLEMCALHGTPESPFHLRSFHLRQKVAKAYLAPMTTKTCQLSRLLWTEAGYELYKVGQC